MNGKVHRRIHIGVGVIGGILLYTNTDVGVFHSLGAFIVFVFCCNLPDLDIRLPIAHRGVSHTFFAALFIGGVVYYLLTRVSGEVPFDIPSVVYAMSVTLSYSFHIIQDMMTKGGGFAVEPFWPISNESMSFGFLTSDHPIFAAISWLILLGAIVWSLNFFGVITIDISLGMTDIPV